VKAKKASDGYNKMKNSQGHIRNLERPNIFASVCYEERQAAPSKAAFQKGASAGKTIPLARKSSLAPRPEKA